VSIIILQLAIEYLSWRLYGYI